MTLTLTKVKVKIKVKVTLNNDLDLDRGQGQGHCIKVNEGEGPRIGYREEEEVLQGVEPLEGRRRRWLHWNNDLDQGQGHRSKKTNEEGSTDVEPLHLERGSKSKNEEVVF